MKFEDMENWTVDQLKEEVVRLSEECEKKQHIILDYKALSETLNQKLLEMITGRFRLMKLKI